MLACILANLIEGVGAAVRAVIERAALVPIRIGWSGVWVIARMKCKTQRSPTVRENRSSTQVVWTQNGPQLTYQGIGSVSLRICVIDDPGCVCTST